MKFSLSLLLFGLLALSPVSRGAEPVFETTTAFPAAPGNRPNYRIPSLIQMPGGDLLVIAERRNDNIGDVGDHDIVMKRSSDLGKTWGKEILIYDDGPNTCTDITLCFDRQQDRLFLFFLQDKKKFVYLSSKDQGRTWQGPVKVHDGVIRPEWDRLGLEEGESADPPIDPESGKTSKARTWKTKWPQRYGLGPGNAGIQLSMGPHAGRLLVPGRHREQGTKGYRTFAHLLYSDDHGATWKLGGNIAEYGSETQLAELADGRILASMRNENPRDLEKRQLVAFSQDGGQTWSEARRQPELITPKVHASVRRYTLAADGGKNRLLFSNPAYAKRENKHPYGRYNMTVRLSYDEGESWTAGRTVYPSVSSYSDLAVLPDGTVGIIYERGPEGSVRYWDELQFARFNLEWLTEGRDSLNAPASQP